MAYEPESVADEVTSPTQLPDLRGTLMFEVNTKRIEMSSMTDHRRNGKLF